MVSKKDYRCHAHTNPFRDTRLEIPEDYNSANWSCFENGIQPTFVDIGCGYGKFLLKTASLYPEENVLGLEIRDKVVEYVSQISEDLPNCSVLKTNALLFLPNFFRPGSLKKIFVLFPDPHFKKRKQKGRIICKQMMQIFKYILEQDGQLYISTDVSDLFKDMCEVIEGSGCFKEQAAPEDDPLFDLCYNGTDEAGRAGIKSGHTFGKIYRVMK
jgi:tRNA (guanine-N7-)-methyltransferase